MPEKTDPRPLPPRDFHWSDIHSLAESRLANLDKALRDEIGASIVPVPQTGGRRYRFFVLLEERATGWAKRAEVAYLDCLKEIGCEPSQSVKLSIWTNGMRFFLRENLRQALILACSIGTQELEWATKGSSRVRGTPRVVTVVQKLHEIDSIIQKLAVKFEFEMTSSGHWLADTQALLKKIDPNWSSPIPASGPNGNPILNNPQLRTALAAQMQTAAPPPSWVTSGEPQEFGSKEAAAVDVIPRPTAPAKKSRPKRKSNEEQRRQAVIFGAIQSNLQGRLYCKELDSRGVAIPQIWKEDGCPTTYEKAYMEGPKSKWTKRIQDQKSKHAKTYKDLSAAQREEIIQSASTRRTR